MKITYRHKHKGGNSKTTQKRKFRENSESFYTPESDNYQTPEEGYIPLQQKCHDIGQCLLFGDEIEEVRHLMDDYHFDNIPLQTFKRIGVESLNGSLYQFYYEKKQGLEPTRVNAVMKITNNKDADSLYHELQVGLYINTYCSKFPCFIETYGMGVRPSLLPVKWKSAKFYQQEGQVFNKMLENETFQLDGNTLDAFIHYKTSTQIAESGFDSTVYDTDVCYNNRGCLFIQHLENVQSFYQLLHADFELKPNFEIKYSVINCLFQIVCPLYFLRKQFRHNDLHNDNILIHTLPINQYVILNYHLSDKKGDVLSFPTHRIAKIIDYGRCTIPDTSTYSVFNMFKENGQPCRGYDEIILAMSGATSSNGSDISDSGLLKENILWLLFRYFSKDSTVKNIVPKESDEETSNYELSKYMLLQVLKSKRSLYKKYTLLRTINIICYSKESSLPHKKRRTK